MAKESLPQKFIAVRVVDNVVQSASLVYIANGMHHAPEHCTVVQVPFSMDDVVAKVFSGSVDADGWCEAPSYSEGPIDAQPLPKLTPMTFYLAFTPAERIKIKASTDAEVMEFWDTYQRAERTETMVDPNLVSVQEGLAYLAQQPNDTPPGPGILASRDRIEQILAGIPQ